MSRVRKKDWDNNPLQSSWRSACSTSSKLRKYDKMGLIRWNLKQIPQISTPHHERMRSNQSFPDIFEFIYDYIADGYKMIAMQCQ
jgi:hypothetical protein